MLIYAKICKEVQDGLFRNNILDDLLLEIIVLFLIYAELCKKFSKDQAIKRIPKKMCQRLICVLNVHIN